MPCTCPDNLRANGRCVIHEDIATTNTTAPTTIERPTMADMRGLPSTSAIDRAILRRSFAAFVARYWPVMTGNAYTENRATRTIIEALQRVADSACTRLLVAIPPGTGKSTLLALFSAWRLARDPSWRSIHASHAYELAATESRRVRRLVSGDEYRAMFPAVELRDDENTAAMWATRDDGRYIAVGTDGALTGRRAHEAIVDDAMNASDRFSKAKRDAVWAWYLESLSTRLDGDRAPLVVVMQRLDRDDLIGRLIEAGGYELIELPAEFPDGKLLAPNVLPREKLDALRAASASTYACQYLQRPSSDEDATVRRSWWRFYRPPHVAPNAPRPLGADTDVPAVDLPERMERVVIAVDMTFGGTKSTSDFCAIQAWGSVGGARYLLERRKIRATQMAQRTAIKEVASRFPGAKILVEKAAGGQGSIEQLTADGIPNIVPVSHGGKGKTERLALVSPTIEGGNAFLPLGAAWLGEFIEELAGNSKHDDEQDACSYALAELNAGGGAIEIDRENYRKAFALLGLSKPEIERRVEETIARKLGASTMAKPKAKSDHWPTILDARDAHARRQAERRGPSL